MMSSPLSRMSAVVATKLSSGVSTVTGRRFASKWAGMNVYRAAQFDRPMVDELLQRAAEMHAEPRAGPLQKYNNLLEGCVMGQLFFEPSTRTQQSFNMGMQRLGGLVFAINADTSSTKKGETMHDTVKVLEQNADVLVIRHHDGAAVAEAMAAASIPVINGGDGAGEHPTQALLDLFCMQQELGVSSVDGLEITLVGDLKYGRTVHSLVQFLALYDDVTVNLVAPKELRMPESVLAKVDGKLKINFLEEYQSVLPSSDILYMTRVQKERFDDVSEYERLRTHFVLGPGHLDAAKPKMAVMHPLPRVGEIDPAVDSDPRAAYFRQVRCGITTRMAIIALCLGKL